VARQNPTTICNLPKTVATLAGDIARTVLPAPERMKRRIPLFCNAARIPNALTPVIKLPQPRGKGLEREEMRRETGINSRSVENNTIT